MKVLYGVKVEDSFGPPVGQMTLEPAGSKTAYTGAQRKLVKIRMEKRVLLDGEYQDVVIEDNFYIDEIFEQLKA